MEAFSDVRKGRGAYKERMALLQKRWTCVGSRARRRSAVADVCGRIHCRARIEQVFLYVGDICVFLNQSVLISNFIREKHPEVSFSASNFAQPRALK